MYQMHWNAGLPASGSLPWHIGMIGRTQMTRAREGIPSMLDNKRDVRSSESIGNQAFQDELPALEAALDANAMRDYLQAALCGSAPTSTIERCIVSKPVYVPGECCIV